MLNLGQARTLTLQYLDDINAGYFDVNTVNGWINNAQKKIQMRLLRAGQNYYLRCVQTPLVVNQSDYVLPLDFKKLHRLEVVISGAPPNEAVNPLVPITLNQQDLVFRGTGTPQAYFFKKNRLVLFPAPDAPLTLRMNYSYAVTDLVNDTDLIDAPEQYHELAAYLAAEDGFMKDGRASEILSKRLEEFRQLMDSDDQERNQDMSREVVSSYDDQDRGFFW